MLWSRALAIASLVLVVGCQERNNPPPVQTGGTGTTAAAGDMCPEHGVLEAVCTQCNPALAAAYQAQNDWCAEHGFPESFCPICSPAAGGRPSANVEVNAAPAEGTKIRFATKETEAMAGIRSEPAVPTSGRVGLVAVARIAYDATRVANVNARAAGVVRSIQVDIGTRVGRGAVLATIESAGVGAEESKLAAATARLEVAQANHTRAKDLLDKGIVPAKEVLLAQQELEVAKAELESTRRALHVVGTSSGDGTYTLTAPLAGVVTQRLSSIGTLIEAGAPLFEIVDPATMWAEIHVPEADLAHVRVGQDVVLRVDALGDRGFPGQIESIAPAIDPKTRTALARARLANPDGLLRAHMYGRAEIAIDDERLGVAVPRDAVQFARGVPVVFVRLASDLYETRRVRLGARSGDWIDLAGNVSPGDLVVTDGSFLLKTETFKGSIGAGCCERK